MRASNFNFMKTIALFSEPDGSSKLEAFNFKGRVCKTATRDYEAALGTAAAAHDKPELRQVETVQTLTQGQS